MAITENITIQPRAQVPEHGMSPAIPPRVGAFADDGHLSEYSASPTMPLRVGAFVDDVHRMHRLRRVGIDTETAIMSSDGLSKYLRAQSDESQNPHLKERYENLTRTQSACARVLDRLKSVPELTSFFGGVRLNAAIPNDTYAEHAARSAGFVVNQFGVHDPSTFALTYLHDVFDDMDHTDPDLVSRITCIVNEEMRGLIDEGVISPEIVSGLKSFAEFDTHSKKVARKIADDLRGTELELGQEFTPKKFHDLQAKITTEYTAQITRITQKQDGTYDVQEESDEEKYPSIYTALHQAANAQGLGLSVYMAHLAAMTDHALHPADKSLAARQESNLDAFAIMLPVFQGVGDVYARYAQDAVCGAFFPEAFRNLKSVAQETSQKHGGQYYDGQAKVYGGIIRHRLEMMMKQGEVVPSQFISDAEMEARKYAFKKGDRAVLLHGGEMYIPGTKHAVASGDVVPPFEMDIKTASSILLKALNKSAQDPCPLHEELKAMLDEGQWGSREFWERFLADVPDLLRTTVVAHTDRAQDLIEKTKHFMKRLSYDPKAKRYATNHADTIYASGDSPDARKNECVEDGKEGFLHIVGRVKPMRLSGQSGDNEYLITPNNCEVHVGGSTQYGQNIGTTHANHGLYKMGLRTRLKGSGLSDSQIQLAMEASAREITTMGCRFMEMTYGSDGLEAAQSHFDIVRARPCIKGCVFER